MAFLTVNGIDASGIVLAAGRVNETRREIGETTGANDGTLRKSRQSVKHDIVFETMPLIAGDAYAWDSLFRGLGERWSFDTSLYGSKGLGPNAGATATQATAGSSKFGAGYLLFTGAQTITYATALGTDWTVLLWRSTDGGTTWHHYVVDSLARKWLDGVRNDGTSTTFLSVASGSVTLSDTTTRIDDLVVLPFVVPAAWPPTIGTSTSAFSDLSKLTIAGLAVQEAATRTVYGECSLEIVKVQMSGTFQLDARRLTVTLSEV